jgi:5-oxoprolinase (ATP-hydrolysing)
MTTTGISATGWTFWIDRGGTFTDVIARDPRGTERTLKLLSSSPAYSDAAVEAMRRFLKVRNGEPFPSSLVHSIRMGTTVATNALLERKGARTLLVTTKGFADSLFIGDQSRRTLFALELVRPDPLHSRVIEVNERLAADGAVVQALQRSELAAELARARLAGFESVAVAFMHSDLNPAHELMAGALAEAAGFSCIALSHEVSPLPRFLPRAETAVADAYLTPVLRAYVDQVAQAVAGAPLWFMTSAGGLVRADAFRGRDAVVSGPAGGVVGVAHTARQAGFAAVLGFDMGGTSTDVCRFAGVLERRDRADVAGARLRSPMLDVETVAAGGGSILEFDGFRARVGPSSAGANPGPAAYGRGGPATVTDANLVLGRLNPAHFPSIFGPAADAPLDIGAARRRLADLATAMGLASPEAAAAGFIAVAVEHTAQAIRRISTERGFDPRDHALVAFGGAAGQLACDVADALGIETVLSPHHASLLSAWGIGQARVQALRQAGLDLALDASGMAGAGELAQRLTAETQAALMAQGAESSTTRVRLMLRYDGADAVLPVPLTDVANAKAAFDAAHQRLFGFIEPSRAILIASVEAEAEADETASLFSAPDSTGHPIQPGADTNASGSSLAVHRVESLVKPLTGPALVARGDTQIAVAEGWTAIREGDGLVRLTRDRDLVTSSDLSDRPDPVTLELFNRRFMGVAEAMGAALERTAHSVNIKERLDFSCALFDTDGGLVANAPHMPVHLGSMGASVRAVQARHDYFRPGDAFVLNNPYFGGTHLPDITVVMPVFMSPHDPVPTFHVAARGHHADVGGIQPGSMPPFSRTIDDEGVLLDALPMMRDGQFLEAEMRAALASGPRPARAPDRNLADLKAQLAACQAGAAAVAQMIERFGPRMVARYMAFVQQNAEISVRRAIGRLKDGAAHIPLDGAGEIVVEVSVDSLAGEATLDFRKSTDQLDSNFNAPSAIVSAAALYVFRTLVDDDIPLNAGCLTPLHILTRHGSMLDPLSPAAVVAGNVETSQHVVDALYEALGVMANSQGSMNNFTFGDEERQYYETICGGAGATANRDGASAIHTHMTNSRMTDPEILERRFPVRLETFEVRRGSGGEGEHRGGDGALRRIRFLAPMDAALLSSRRLNVPRGLAGGGDALPGHQRLITAQGEVKVLDGCFSIRVAPGDVIEIETPGGGGFGPKAGDVGLAAPDQDP